MLKKIKQWWKLRKRVNTYESDFGGPITREQVENAYLLGYNDGRKDGLTIAREQATKSLKEILWQQNKKSQK
jgi:hypothetical protein